MSPLKSLPVLAAIALSSLLSGCLGPVLVAPSSAPLEGRSYVTTGKTTGEACMSNILGIPLSTDASLKTAMKRAMEMASAQALIDIVVDNRYLYTLFYNRSCTVVTATGIRFTSQPAPYLKPTPAVPTIPPTPGTEKPAPEAAAPAVEHKRPPRAPEENAPEAKPARKKSPSRKAKPARKKAPARKARPIPDQFKTFCKYSPGDRIKVETKSRVIEAGFVSCVHKGIRVRPKGKAPTLIPFKKIWMVKLVSRASPRVKPVVPITPETSKPAKPRTPAQPRKPAVPR